VTQPRPIFVVAMEYLGADVAWRRGTPRQPTCEHAYDLNAGRLAAHDGHPPRVEFPDQQRGWVSEPCAPRCRECNDQVDLVIASMIADHLRTFLPPR
jgi:hypothetical protein